ncbi:Alpha/Beta hydrolase protein [Fusarium flagelliforme]|nr:Alpha/Beta hydrolase protein [Fusarium flagelliforme]KAH7174483.1 Alpha/Beta hydrolase protein [Fusarium flagelliforme]
MFKQTLLGHKLQRLLVPRYDCAVHTFRPLSLWTFDSFIRLRASNTRAYSTTNNNHKCLLKTSYPPTLNLKIFPSSILTMAQSPYIVEPTGPHTHSLIILHGLGSNGKKFGRKLLETGICSDGKSLPELLPGARFIFPTSKKRRSSAFRRSKLTQWFNIASLEDPSYRNHTQAQGLEESSLEIFDLLDQERQKVPDKNIILGGISQGCAMGLVCLLAMDFPIGGYFGMSSWLPFATEIQDFVTETEDAEFSDEDENPFDTSDDDEIRDLRTPSAKVHDYMRDLISLETHFLAEMGSLSTPVFMGHGDADWKIKPALGEEACRTLRSVGFDVEWKLYEGLGHWYRVPDEIDDIVNFIRCKVGWSL